MILLPPVERDAAPESTPRRGWTVGRERAAKPAEAEDASSDADASPLLPAVEPGGRTPGRAAGRTVGSAAGSTPVRRRSRRRTVRAVVLAFAVLTLFTLGWIGVRGTMAGIAVAEVAGEAARLNDALLDQDVASSRSSIDTIQRKSAEVASLTGDPVWRAAEFVPVLGSNLSTVRESVAALGTVVDDGLPALARLAGEVNLSDLMREGREQRRASIAVAAPHLDTLTDTLAAANARLDGIDPSSNISAVSDAFGSVRETMRFAGDAVSGMKVLSALAPLLSSPDGAAEWLLTVNAGTAAGGEGIVHLPVSVAGGMLTVGTPIPASTGTPDTAAEVRRIDLAVVQLLAERFDTTSVVNVGDVSSEDVKNFLTTGAYDVAPDAASAQTAIGAFTAEVLRRVFN